MKDAVAVQWDVDFMDPKKIWPSTPRTQTSFVDFCLWALEPMPINHKDGKLRTNKGWLVSQALTMLTQVAACLENTVLPAKFRWANSAADVEDRPF